MKTAVHFGAGKIGRGFIAELLHDSGYKIVFVDVVDALVDLVNKEHKYNLYLIDKDHEKKIIDNVEAFSSIKEPERVIEAIKEAEIITTSVMATNLDKIAPILAKGLCEREDQAIVMACENAIMGTNILRDELLKTGIISEEKLVTVTNFANTAVDRMVFDYKDGIEIGGDFELAIEDVLGTRPIVGAEYVDDIGKYLQRKIYMINCGHALSAYFGFVAGYDILQDALRDPEIQSEVRAAVLESASALEQEYGFKHEDLVEYMEGMLIRRFTTPGVKDDIARVAREPIRKISPNDRIMGPAFMCEKYGLDNTHLLKGVACALKYKNDDDEQAVELQNYIKDNGIEKAISHFTGIDANSDMFKKVLDYM
ncbi:MAG: mannitol-1-phosphate 5-dehydrogenase [Coriobacteriia bacterium]|nr:mannitol-1-phosphate 5-dehydrogenase [Coriobacteriia bacterium]